MLVSTSWLLAAGRETIGLLLSRMVAYSGGKLAVKQTKFKPKYAAFFNSTHPQLSGIAHKGTEGQGDKGTEGQGDKGTEGQSNGGMEGGSASLFGFSWEGAAGGGLISGCPELTKVSETKAVASSLLATHA